MSRDERTIKVGDLVGLLGGLQTSDLRITQGHLGVRSISSSARTPGRTPIVEGTLSDQEGHCRTTFSLETLINQGFSDVIGLLEMGKWCR